PAALRVPYTTLFRSFDRGVGTDVLQDTRLQAYQIADVAVATVAAGFVLQLGQACAGATEQASGVAEREKHVVAADQVLLAELEGVAIVVGDVFVGGVVAAFIGHLTGADAPGAAVLDHIVEAVAAHVLLQGGGAVDIGGALAPGEADEVFGGM